MNFPPMSMPFGNKGKESQEKSAEQPKVTASQKEFDSYIMSAENSPHPKQPEKTDAPSSSFASGISKFSLPLGGKSEDAKPRPPEIKTRSQQEYEQYEMTAENSPHPKKTDKPAVASSSSSSSFASSISKFTLPLGNKNTVETKSASQQEYEQYEQTAENSPYKASPPPAATAAPASTTTSKFSFGATLSKLTQKSHNPKDLHVDTSVSNSYNNNSKTKGEEDYEQFAATAENSPDKKVQPKPAKMTVASRMRSLTDSVSTLGKNISEMLDLPEPTTHTTTASTTAKSGSSSSSGSGSGSRRESEPDIFSSSVIDVVKALGNDLKQGASKMIPVKSSTSTATTAAGAGAGTARASPATTAAANGSGVVNDAAVRSSSTGRRVKPPPPKDNTRIFDYLEMSKDDEEGETGAAAALPRYQPTQPRDTTVPPLKPSKDSKTSALFTPVKGAAPSPTTASNSSNSGSSGTAASGSEGLNTTTLSTPQQDSSFDYLAHNISLDTDLTPIRSPLNTATAAGATATDSNNLSGDGNEDQMERLLRDIYESEHHQPAIVKNEENDEELEQRLRASSSEDALEDVKPSAATGAGSKIFDSADAAEYEDDYCV